ncbi:MAG: PAS domain S-box protein [Anaerolineales bacterium]|nr:PAS domain S-box protein [Anaerolineales bacterium]
MIVIGFVLAVVFLLLDSVVLSFIFQSGNFVSQLFTPGLSVMVRRVLVIAFLLVFASIAQWVANKRGQVEKTLTEDEERFRRLVELSPDAIAIQSEDKIVYVNPAGAELFGYGDVAELIGRSVWDFVPARYKPIVEKRYRRMREEGTMAPPVEMELLRLDGLPVDVEVSAIPFTFKGKPAIQAIFHDITARKLVEEQIRQRNIELAALNAIAATVSHSLDLEKILNDSLDDVMHLDILGGDTQGMIFLVDEFSDTLTLVAHRGAPENHPCLKQPPRIGECLCGLAVQMGEPVLSEDCYDDVRHTRRWSDMLHHRDVCLPLKVRGNVLGAMDIRLPASKEIGENVVELLSSVADQISVAVENARLFEEVSRQSERLRVLSVRLAEAEETERQRLARELHDQVGQGLTALGINLNIIRTQLPESELERLHQYLDDSFILVEKTTERIRGVMSELRPPMLDDYGLLATLQWYGEQFSDRVGIDVTVSGDEPIPRLSSSVEGALFRISTEALTNVAKHAQASKVIVSIDQTDKLLQLVIADDGVGFETRHPSLDNQEGGWGLLIMSERAEALGGTCKIEPRDSNGGTRVVAEIPR